MIVKLLNEAAPTATVESLRPGTVFRLKDAHGGSDSIEAWLLLSNKAHQTQANFTYAVKLCDGSLIEVSKKLNVIVAAYAEVNIKA